MKSENFLEITIAGEDKTAELKSFANFVGLERVAANRYSTVLLLQLFIGFAARDLNPAKIVREIEDLEGNGEGSRTKPPVLFKHPPLKGLWHKHYLADGLSSMARNLRNGIAKNGLPWVEDRVRETMESGEERYMTEEDIKAIVQDAVHGNWIRRAEAKELTGEWIIYAEYEGAKYYLSLGGHESGDSNLRQQIDLCFHEFPFLEQILEPPTL